MSAVEFGAELSSDGRYRYRLWRSWGPGSRCIWIMLNPSTADASVDDPTIRKCMGFAKRWGHDGIEVVNLFALRSTNPRMLYSADDPVGPGNNEAILSAARSWSYVVCGWGNHGGLHNRSAQVVRLLRGECVLTALCVTKQSQPGHPLYVSYENSAQHWQPEGNAL